MRRDTKKIVAVFVTSIMMSLLLADSSLTAYAAEETKNASDSAAEMPVPGMSEEIKTPYYFLHFSPKYKEDAEKASRFLNSGIESLKLEFAKFPVDELLKVQCDIYLYPQKTESVNDGGAHISNGDNNGVYSAKVHILTPSLVDSSWRSKVGESASDDTFFRLIMHEYSTILLDRICRTKVKGLKFYRMPSWFSQGYEEYCALLLSSPSNKTGAVEKYLASYRTNPERVNFDFGVNIQNDYVDGAMLLLFMNETFGKQKVQSILTSTEPSFGKAVVKSLGVDIVEFGRGWDTWLSARVRNL